MSYIARGFAAGAVGALAVVFGKSTYEAFIERQSLQKLETEKSAHQTELMALETNINASKAALASLEDQSKSAGTLACA